MNHTWEGGDGNVIDLEAKAIRFAKAAHFEQKDDCGLDYFEAHLCNVADIIKCVTDDENLICAAYLHDTIEDSETTYEELVKEFNQEVANLVNEVTHEGRKDNHGFYFPRLKSKKGIMLKFADRLSNTSRMESWSKKRQDHYLKKSKFWKSKPPLND